MIVIFNFGSNKFTFFNSIRGSMMSNINSSRNNFNDICNSGGYGDSDEGDNEDSNDNNHLNSILWFY